MRCSSSGNGHRILAAFLLAACGCAVHAQDRHVAPERITPAVKVFQQASPAVVNISTTTIVTYRNSFGFGGIFEDIFDFPTAQPRSFRATSVGSGFVIHRDGYVVTNAHVVARTAERKISFADGTELPAEVVALDAEHDLAVLKVEPDHPLPYLHLGRSDDLMPGETVFAIGNPLGYKHTVTTGIISAVDRELRFSDRVAYKGLIQTDASINPGNSGGPLFNITGELIGINTAIRGDAQNIGFAIPVDRLHELLPEMLDIERLRRVAFGAHFGAVVRDGALQGVRVLEVEAGSPAGKAGLRSGDVIRAVNRHETPNYVDIFSILADASVDKPLAFEIAQGNGRLRTLNIALADVPRPDGINLMRQRFGLGIRELKPSELEALGLRTAIGLVVAEVKAGTQAAREGVESGDLITSIAGRPVNTLDQAGHLLENIHRGDQAAFGVTRIGTDAIIRVELVLKAL